MDWMAAHCIAYSLSCFIFQQMRGLEPADIWLAILFGHITRGTLSVGRFRQGKWRDIVVDIEPSRA